MRRPRFFVERIDADEACLVGPQAHHALRVLRLTVGDTISLFDAADRRAHGTITRIDADRVLVRVSSQLPSPGEPSSASLASEITTLVTAAGLTLATAIPKGDRADWLIEKCAELGVAALWPVTFERSVVTPGPAKIERWRRKVIEAAKQAMPPRLLKIEMPCSLQDVGKRIALAAPLWFGDPGNENQPFARAASQVAQSVTPCSQAVMFIGPEGGLTDRECDRLQSLGAAPVSLGPAILRIETACVAAAAVWLSFAKGS